MRLLKTNVLLRLLNSYIVDSPQPANLSYLWNFGSLLGTCLIIQILTGIFSAMHYQPHVDFVINHCYSPLGYLLPYSQMSLWGFFNKPQIALSCIESLLSAICVHFSVISVHLHIHQQWQLLPFCSVSMFQATCLISNSVFFKVLQTFTFFFFSCFWIINNMCKYV